MAGRGPAPKPNRRSRDKLIRGPIRTTSKVGWQHGPKPKPPPGLMPASKVAWDTWMTSWWAAHWTKSDLPLIRQAIRIFDQVERGEFQRVGELRLWADTLGISPKGQQDRHWLPPEDQAKPSAPQEPAKAEEYQRLRVVE